MERSTKRARCDNYNAESPFPLISLILDVLSAHGRARDYLRASLDFDFFSDLSFETPDNSVVLDENDYFIFYSLRVYFETRTTTLFAICD